MNSHKEVRAGWLARATAITALIALTACAAPAAAPPLPGTASPGATTPSGTAPDGPALAVLGTLDVKGRAPTTGYDRGLFGQAWADTDRNGCDTRNDILARDLAGATFRPGTRDCVVLTGTLDDPYTGQTIRFTKDNAGAVQIDHVVALSDAWQKGAQQWDAQTRQAFANDPLNLLAVDGSANASKSDGDAATWLPPNRTYRCAMVARQIAVKVQYRLWMTAAERDASARLLGTCPGEQLPAAATTTAPAPVPAQPATPDDGLDPDYGTCTLARANDAGPYVEGTDAEYDWYRDGDGDGTVCE